mmetsp:Transcript_51184/g.165766  ORF Transcript_51184/g.165766 Transcript_51184/m.165766 type:complete len:254 (-) Transcript_51184:215-976(-)
MEPMLVFVAMAAINALLSPSLLLFDLLPPALLPLNFFSTAASSCAAGLLAAASLLKLSLSLSNSSKGVRSAKAAFIFEMAVSRASPPGWGATVADQALATRFDSEPSSPATAFSRVFTSATGQFWLEPEPHSCKQSISLGGLFTTSGARKSASAPPAAAAFGPAPSAAGAAGAGGGAAAGGGSGSRGSSGSMGSGSAGGSEPRPIPKLPAPVNDDRSGRPPSEGTRMGPALDECFEGTATGPPPCSRGKTGCP